MQKEVVQYCFCCMSVSCVSETMKLLFLSLIIQVAQVASLREVSGHFGDSVILHSGADPSWNLSSIKWSIFLNNTWIATYGNGKINTERLDRYKGRLSLNTSSGDLTIRDLTTEDAMEYTVDLINTMRQNSGKKTKLTVTKPLQTPTIETIASSSVNGGCWLWLNCSSPDKGVDLSWQGKHPSVKVFNMSNPEGNSAVRLAFLNTPQNNVEFTCTSSRNTEKESKNVTLKCEDKEPQPQPHPESRERPALFLFIGGLVGSSLTIFIIYIFGEHIKAAWVQLKVFQEDCFRRNNSIT